MKSPFFLSKYFHGKNACEVLEVDFGPDVRTVNIIHDYHVTNCSCYLNMALLKINAQSVKIDKHWFCNLFITSN